MSKEISESLLYDSELNIDARQFIEAVTIFCQVAQKKNMHYLKLKTLQIVRKYRQIAEKGTFNKYY